MGNGTWTLSGASALLNFQGATNFTFNANSSTITFTGTVSGTKRLLGGNKTFNNFSTAASGYSLQISQANTFNTFTVAAPNRILFPGNTTTTITTLTNISASVSNPVLF